MTEQTEQPPAGGSDSQVPAENSQQELQEKKLPPPADTDQPSAPPTDENPPPPGGSEGGDVKYPNLPPPPLTENLHSITLQSVRRPAWMACRRPLSMYRRKYRASFRQVRHTSKSIHTVSLADLREGASNFFHFHAVISKNYDKSRLAPPFWGWPPLGNPGSTTEFDIVFCHVERRFLGLTHI